MPAKLIPDKAVEMMIRRGMTPTEIREALLKDYRIDVTIQAISLWRKRRGLPAQAPRYEGLLPWRVAPEHAHKWPARMLRLAARREAGGDLNPTQERDLDNWLARLTAENLVVAYDRNHPDGWYYHERRPKVDQELISNPDVPFA